MLAAAAERDRPCDVYPGLVTAVGGGEKSEGSAVTAAVLGAALQMNLICTHLGWIQSTAYLPRSVFPVSEVKFPALYVSDV